MESAKKLRKRANNILEHRIPYLKEKLAVFNTQPLPLILGADESIPA